MSICSCWVPKRRPSRPLRQCFKWLPTTWAGRTKESWTSKTSSALRPLPIETASSSTWAVTAQRESQSNPPTWARPLSSRDLAARKTLALFGRAAPRDFAGVYDFARRYGRDRLIDWAAADDPGFDEQIIADMLASIDRLTDEDLPVDAKRVSAVRDYFRAWATELAPP
jgi:hypothetical protein